MENAEITSRLCAGAQQMGIALDARAAERFCTYLDMLGEANQHMNLTAVLEPAEAIDRHFLDSLAPLAVGALPRGASLVDVGTGAGFPGLPLLIARPDLKLTLVDALGKRLNFLRTVLDALGLEATIVHARAEDFAHTPAHRERYDFAVARAVAALPTLLEYLLPCVQVGGNALCWKGPAAPQETADATRALQLLGGGDVRILPYAVPERDWQHSLVQVSKLSKTPKGFPRRAGTPAKEPLQ